MNDRPTDNTDQAEFWSTTAGENWVACQAAMDTLLAPVLDLVLDHAKLQPGEHVLDIGCGAGTSTAQAARQVGVSGSATGLDISDTLLAQARQQYGNSASFVLADAQTHAFDPGQSDILISRFGVMFFADNVAAFANMARALKPGGRMILAAWGPAPNNPWFMIPAQVAAARLGKLPKTDRTLPGPFAFEDQARVVDILARAGLNDITAKTHRLHLTPQNGVEGAATLCCQIGPAEKALRHFEASQNDRDAIRADIADAFKPFDGPTLRIPADINLFTATR